MADCAVKRGFFVLRDCGGPAANQCSACQRLVCIQHMVSRGPNILCLECNARQEQLTDEERQERLQDPTDPSGVYAYRQGYYTRYGYRPFYSGFFYDDYYDDYDLRSFDQAPDEGVEGEEDSGAGFMDS
jgi:hypothetical protein